MNLITITDHPHFSFHEGILSGGEIQQQTRWLQCQVVTTMPHRWTIPFSDFLVSIFPDASDHYWTGSGQHRATAACVERNEVLQKMKCVSAATSRQYHISLIPARWLNSTVVHNVYTLQTKLLLIGWRHTAHISTRNITSMNLWSNASALCSLHISKHYSKLWRSFKYS